MLCIVTYLAQVAQRPTRRCRGCGDGGASATGEERVDLAAALQRLRSRLGVTCVVSTAGGGLNGALLRAGLVDEIQLIVLPAAIGGYGVPTLFDGSEFVDGELPTRLRLLSVQAETDGTLCLRYEALREAASTSAVLS